MVGLYINKNIYNNPLSKNFHNQQTRLSENDIILENYTIQNDQKKSNNIDSREDKINSKLNTKQEECQKIGNLCVFEQKLDFSLPILNNKIVLGNKYFDNPEEAAKYLVNLFSPYSFNLKINYKYDHFLTNRVHISTNFYYFNPKYINTTIYVDAYKKCPPKPLLPIFNKNNNSCEFVYSVNSQELKDPQEAIKAAISEKFGKYKNLSINKYVHFSKLEYNPCFGTKEYSSQFINSLIDKLIYYHYKPDLEKSYKLKADVSFLDIPDINFDNILNSNNKIDNISLQNNQESNIEINNNNINKQNKLKFVLKVLNDKIIFEDKEFNDIKEAVNYAVKKQFPNAYNIKIIPTNIYPTKIHVLANFEKTTDNQEPKIIIDNLYIPAYKKNNTYIYKFYDKLFSDQNEVIKFALDYWFGKYDNLSINNISVKKVGEFYWLVANVGFRDIPDIQNISD